MATIPGLGSESHTRTAASFAKRMLGIVRRMDWLRGLRAGTALSTPLLLADFTGLTHLGWTALGGMEAIVTNAGGPYRARLGRLSVLSLGGAFGLFVGTLAGNDLRWAIPVTFIFCFVWTYLTVLGQPFASASLLVQVIFVCGVGEPDPSWREALLRACFLLAGGAWATLLSLLLWPLDPYRPARSAVSQVFQELANALESIQVFVATPHTAGEWHQINFGHKSKLRRLIELSWEAISSVRAQASAETAQGRGLIVLIETADILLERYVALAEHAESMVRPDSLPAGPATSLDYETVGRLADTCRWVASILVRSRTNRHANAGSVHDFLGTVIESSDGLRELVAGASTANEISDRQFFTQQVVEIASNLDTAVETSTLLRYGSLPKAETGERIRDGRPDPRSAIEQGVHPTHASRERNRSERNQLSAWDRLAANWSTSSLSLRHAVRVALVCSFDICIVEKAHLGHGYWLMLTSLIVLQPHVSGTMRRGMQRVAGTVGGGIFAALLAITLHSQLVTGIVLFPLGVLALALLPVNYAAFSFFLTPSFVLAFLRHPGDWQLAFIRVGNTIAGASISIAAMTVLFPAYERERIGNFLLESLVANRRYLEQLIESWNEQTIDQKSIALARRATGLAHNDMEESLERVLAENWARKASSDNLLAFAAYLHRFSQSITGLAAVRPSARWRQSAEVQSQLKAIHQRLEWLERNLEPRSDGADGFVPTPSVHGNIQAVEGNGPGERQLVRLDRQVQVMQRHLESMRHEPWLLSS